VPATAVDLPDSARPPLFWLVVATAVALTLALVAAVAFTSSAVIEIEGGALTLAAFVAFVVPGVLVVRAACPGAGSRLALAFGPVVGFALTSVTLLGFWLAGARGPWLLVAAPAVAALAAYPARALRGRLTLTPLERRDTPVLLALLLVVPLTVGLPFARVGERLPEGEAYRAYFTADYIWRRVVVAEVSKGDIPPANPFYRDDALHYYWLPHLLPALEYRHFGSWLGPNAILLSQSLYIDLIFVAFLYGLVRQVVASRAAAATGVLAAVWFTSFEGLYFVAELWARGHPLELVRYVNIDAITRWERAGLPVDGLQRLLLYQPHHAVGYALGLLGLLVAARRARVVDPIVMTAASTLLALNLLVSSFSALMLVAAVALYECAGAARHRDLRRLTVHALAGAPPLAVAALAATSLQYVDHGGSIVMLTVNGMAVDRPITNTILSFGPMLLAGLAGIVVAWRRRIATAWPFLSLLAICALFYVFVDVRDHQDVYVGWRAGHLGFMALAAFVGLAVEAVGRQSGARRWVAAGAMGLLAAAAAPTTAIDLYNTQDIWNRGEGPGFRWTLLLTPEEQRVLGYLRRFTPPDARVQVDPTVRDPDTWAYVPAFAERRMAVGLPISMVPIHKYVVGSERIHRLFTTDDADEAFAIAEAEGIDYLLVGPPERGQDPGCEARFDAARGRFTLLFRGSLLSLYRVDRGRSIAQTLPRTSPNSYTRTSPAGDHAG